MDHTASSFLRIDNLLRHDCTRPRMMDDTLVEIDTRTLKATPHFIVTKNKETGLTGPPQLRTTQSTHSMHGNAGHGSEPPKPATFRVRGAVLASCASTLKESRSVPKTSVKGD